MMPTTNARKQVIPLGTEASFTRATIFEQFGLSISDVVPVANVTDRAQVVSDLTAKGRGPTSTRPLVVIRADAPGLHRIEYTYDGSVWLPASGVMTFPTITDATSFATANSGLLSVGDRCRIGGIDFRWTGTLWVRPNAAGLIARSTDAAGQVVIDHGMNGAPVAVTVTVASDSPVIAHRLTFGVDQITATQFRVTVWRQDTAAVFAGNPVRFYWSAVA